MSRQIMQTHIKRKKTHKTSIYKSHKVFSYTEFEERKKYEITDPVSTAYT